jgi:viroplasmin and RNaseH domain-containing protein
VTGFDGAELKDFNSLEDARNSMRRKGFETFDEALKCTTGDTATLPCRGVYYYAVANGRTIGIFKDWR